MEARWHFPWEMVCGTEVSICWCGLWRARVITKGPGNLQVMQNIRGCREAWRKNNQALVVIENNFLGSKSTWQFASTQKSTQLVETKLKRKDRQRERCSYPLCLIQLLQVFSVINSLLKVIKSVFFSLKAFPLLWRYVYKEKVQTDTSQSFG